MDFLCTGCLYSEWTSCELWYFQKFYSVFNEGAESKKYPEELAESRYDCDPDMVSVSDSGSGIYDSRKRSIHGSGRKNVIVGSGSFLDTMGT